VRGNSQARFLGGLGLVTAPGYPTNKKTWIIKTIFPIILIAMLAKHVTEDVVEVLKVYVWISLEELEKMAGTKEVGCSLIF